MELVIASRNAHKIKELEAILRESLSDVKLLSLDEAGIFGEIEENGTTFGENALIKARAAARSGKIGVGDDSGLCVNALGGAPGVYSARYAGEEADDDKNIDKLLNELHKLPDAPRDAKFVCAICVCRPDGEVLHLRGESEGVIIDERKGDGRFGYDPIFLYPLMGKTFAEMNSLEKNSVSHRGRAIEKLLEEIDFLSK